MRFAKCARLAWGWVVLVACVLAAAMPAAAARTEPPEPNSYQVRPGDTLTAIADRFGVPARTLMRVNALRDPRDLCVGQMLTVSTGMHAEGVRVAVDSHTELLSLSRAAGAASTTVAQVNRLLRPTALPLGLALWLPQQPTAVQLSVAPLTAAPRVVTAARYGLGLWDVLLLNPRPGTLGQPLLVPEGIVSAPMSVGDGPRPFPHPVERIQVSDQPVARGDTSVVTVETSLPVACTFTYLDRAEACVDPSGEGRRWHALVALSPMLAPGAVTVTIELRTPDGDGSAVPVRLHVGAGRFDYERIDLPSERQSLLDPQLSQAETAKIAALRPLRSPTRHFRYPFRRPVASAVTSYFGSRRSYGYGFSSYHAGTDFDGEIGMAVTAPSGGVVVLAEPLVVRGNAIVIDHGWGVVSGYWHLSEVGVTVGQRVEQGDRIGTLGNTGLSTGAHLHWELWVNGVAVNPLSWLDPEGAASVLGPTP